MVRAARDARAALTVLAILAVVVGAPLLYLGWRKLDGQRGAGQAALQADWLLIPGYVLAGLGVFGLGALFLYGSGARRVARWCAGGVLLVAAADVAERPGDTLSEVATPLAVLKFAVGGPLLPVFVVIGSVLLGRRLSGPSRVRRREDAEEPEIARAGELDPGTDHRPDIILPPAVADASTATLSATVGQSGPDVQQELYTEAGRDHAAEVAAAAGGHARPDLPGAAQARWRNAGRVPPGRPPAEVGICASGGGIRSASVTLGALQALQRDVLSRARYLVSVSGGGYMTGAFQLALTRANPEAESLATPGDVFTPGSAEEDHLRRHGKYLADGGREWLTALGVVLRGVAASLGLLTLGVVVIGVGLNAFYRAAPVVDVTRLLPRFDPASGPEPAPYPAPPAAVWWTLGVGAAIAAAWVVVMVGLLASNDRLGLARVARNLFRATVGVTAVIAVYAIAVPAVVWAMTRLTWATPGREPGAGRLLHRRRHHPAHLVRRPGRHDMAADREAAGQRGQAGAGRPAGPPGPGRGGRAAGRHRARAAPDRLGGARGADLRVRVRGRLDDRGRPPLAGLAGPGPAGRAGRGGLPDRPDLAGAAPVLPAPAGLGVRRPPGPHARRRDRCPGLRDRGADHPQQLRPAGRRVPAGHLRGRRRPVGAVADPAGTPGGGVHDVGGLCRRARRRLGPDQHPGGDLQTRPTAGRDRPGGHGRVRGGDRLGHGPPRRRRAAAAGPVERAARDLAAQPGLPGRARPARRELADARLPGARRLPYQLREIIGAYPAEGRMLLCTDGGHWENLGLVELLRHRCRTVYCLDASGDAPPFATTLAEAITLAYEELGVRITLRDPTGLVPGSAAPLEPSEALGRLNARLSGQAVVRGDIEYPEPFAVTPDEEPSRHGTLVVAKAVLTPDMPYELLTYALKEPAFPRQSTGDQFFDHEQFDAYRALGFHIGTAALKAGQG